MIVTMLTNNNEHASDTKNNNNDMAENDILIAMIMVADNHTAS